MRQLPPTKKPKHTIEEFVSIANLVHQNRYDYRNLEHAHLNKKLPIVCSIHGEFHQYGHHHLAGRGCNRCGILARSGAGTTRSARIAISGGEAIAYGRVRIVCESHGPFTVGESQFLKKTHQCSECFIERRKLLLKDKKSYYQQVKNVTEHHWNHNRGFIDPHFESKPRGRFEYHLDHIFSRYDGFRMQVDPRIVGHWCNLMLIPHYQNLARGKHSLRSRETLIQTYERCYEDYPDER